MMKNKWLLLLSLLLSFTCLAAADSWWFAPDGTHARYRVPVTVTLKGSEQEQDFPVEQQLDFASLVDLGGEEIDPNSVVVVDRATGLEVPSLFLPAAPGSSEGTVMWKAVGTLSAAAPRQFYIYFDTTEQEAAPPKGVVPSFGFFLEAEAADSRHPSFSISKTDDPEASGGKWLFAGPGGSKSSSFYWEFAQVEIPIDGTYNIYARVGGNSDEHTFGLQINSTHYPGVKDKFREGWQWICQPDINIEAGTYKIAMSLTDATEKQLTVDLILITNYKFNPQSGFVETAVGSGEKGSQFLPITQWLTTGTIPGVDFEEELLDPQTLWPVENGSANGVKWGVLANRPDGIVTIPGDAGPGYTHVYLYAAKSRQLQLQVHHNFSCKIYLNGTSVYERSDSGANLVDVQFNQGWNRLLVKFAQQPGGILALNVATADGKLPRDVYYTLNDPLHLHILNLETQSSGFAHGGWYPEYVLQFAVTRQALVNARVLYDGRVVKELCHNRLVSDGSTVLGWDGTDASGKAVADGDYQIEITVTDFFNSADVEVVEVPVQILTRNIPTLRLKLPVADSISVEAAPLFSWEGQPGVKKYILQYSQDPEFQNSVSEQTLTGTEYQLTSNLSSGVWYWRVIGIDEYGNAGYSPVQTFTISSFENATGNEPFGIFHLQVEPNPFSPNGDGARDEAVISFVLASDGGTELTAQIYNFKGQLIRTLVLAQPFESGQQILFWDGRDQKGDFAANGLYFVFVQAVGKLGETTSTLKAPIVLVR